MKNVKIKFFIPLFLYIFIVPIFICFGVICFGQQKSDILAKLNQKQICAAAAVAKENDMVFKFSYKGKNFKFLSSEVLNDLELTPLQKVNISTASSRLETYNKIIKFLPTKLDAIFYAYPELGLILTKLTNALSIDAEPAEVEIIQNSCKLNFIDAKSGIYLDNEAFADDFIKQAKLNKKVISFEIKTKNYDFDNNLKSILKEKGCFSTNFSSSNEARKNNIKVALSAFDGLVLEDGEMLSFNGTTGIRCAENGYMPAKIITGGTFVEGFGGGVCQVSTTLYNACLLSGLEIVEVHNHSLPVSYIEPSFDAMVNVGSSDLVIRNNSGGRLIFTTSSKNDICKVKIFGMPNKYKITRHAEKTQILPAEPDFIDTDFKKYGLELSEGEEKRISYAKDGYLSNGYLNFYDSRGNLIETKKIRSNRYNPTKGLIVKNIG